MFVKNEKSVPGIEGAAGLFFGARGFETKEQVEKFLDFTEDDLRTDYLDLDKVCQAIIDHPKDELITIYGDYDCDGITATAINILSLRMLGYRVNFHINNRRDDGFGMNEKGISKLLSRAYNRQMEKNENEGLAWGEDWSEIPTLVLTCDNGIASMAAIKELQEKGLNFLQTRQPRGKKKVNYPVTPMTVLVTDHHEQVGMPLERFAIINQDDKMLIKDEDGNLIEIPEGSVVANGYAIPAGYEIWKDWVIQEGCAICCPTVDEWRLDESAEKREEICGAEVARRVMIHLSEMLGKYDYSHFEKMLVLSGIATVADCVNMASPANHWLAKEGLSLLNEDTGFFALEEIKRQENLTKIDETTIGFTIGPLFNAISRIAGDPSPGVNMLIENPADAEGQQAILEDVSEIKKLNNERKAVTNKDTRKCLLKVEERFEKYGEDPVIVVQYGENAGVAGIIASRIAENYERPALVVSEKGSGSARSIPGINLIKMMMEADDLWNKDKNGNPIRGGHAGAAGFSLDPENIGALRERFKNVELPKPADDIVDAILPVSDWNNPDIAELKKYAPFGEGFPAPQIVLKGIVRNVNLLPRETILKNHVLFDLCDFDGKIHCAWWHNAFKWSAFQLKMAMIDDDEVEVLGTLDEDTFNKRGGYLFTVSKITPLEG